MQNSPTLCFGSGHSKVVAHPSNSAPLLTQVGSLRLPIGATRPTPSSISTGLYCNFDIPNVDFSARYSSYLCNSHYNSFLGHTWVAPSFDIGIEHDDVPPEDAKTPNLPHPLDPKASSNSQMLVGPLHNNSKETPPTSQCQTPMLMAPQLSTHISASKVLVNQVLDTPVKSIAPLVATPMTAEMAKHYTAHQIPEQFLKNTSATPNELAENMSEQFLID